MKTIPLSVTGKKYAGMYDAIVDDDMYEYLSQWNWSVHMTRDRIYAYRKTQNNHHIFMHMAIADAPDGMEVDHKDGNGLNNLRENLRVCSHSQNLMNKRTPTTNTSGYRGVSIWGNKWAAKIRANNKNITLGVFDNPEDAARVYDDAARRYFGEFARTNFD